MGANATQENVINVTATVISAGATMLLPSRDNIDLDSLG